MKNPKNRAPRPLIYDRLKFRLEQEQQDLERRLDRTERQLMNADPSRTDVLDPGAPDQEVLIERSSHYCQRLKMVMHGLERIREGTFGVCEICEEPIGHKRLEALPTARYCITCQEQIEQAADVGSTGVSALF